MRILTTITALAALSSCKANIEETDAPETQPPSELRVLSYNTFMRPSTIGTADNSECRGTQIGEWMTEEGFDLIGLQETWHTEGVAALLTSSGEAYEETAVDLPTPDGTMGAVSGGLSIFSRWPIIETNTIIYSDCEGEDCLAAKGALHAEVQLSTHHNAHIVVTHLQSGKSDTNKAVRAIQLPELAAFIADIDTESGPVFVMGDFNITSVGEQTEYAEMLDTLGVNDPSPDTPTTVNCGGQTQCAEPDTDERIDYILTQSGDSRLHFDEMNVDPMATDSCGEGVDHLSDHRSVTASYTTSFSE